MPTYFAEHYKTLIEGAEHQLTNIGSWADCWGYPKPVETAEVQARLGRAATQLLLFLCVHFKKRVGPKNPRTYYTCFAGRLEQLEDFPIDDQSLGGWTARKLKRAREILSRWGVVTVQGKDVVYQGIDTVERTKLSYVAVSAEMYARLIVEFPIKRPGTKSGFLGQMPDREFFKVQKVRGAYSKKGLFQKTYRIDNKRTQSDVLEKVPKGPLG